MHPNPIFHKTETAQSIAFARARGFGVLAICDPATQAPLMSHLPLLLAEDGSHVLMHLVRSNPIARAAREGVAARLDVSGPDGYISPDWYGIDDQVPTWNYVAVSLTGTLRALPQEQLLPVLEAQSAYYEGQLAPKPVWTIDKMTPEARDRLLRMIVPFRLEVAEIDSTWKLSQNKDSAARHAAADQVTTGFGQELDTLARLIRTPPDLPSQD